MNSPTLTFLAESEVLPSPQETPVSAPLDSAKSNLSPAVCLPSDFQGCPTLETLPSSAVEFATANHLTKKPEKLFARDAALISENAIASGQTNSRTRTDFLLSLREAFRVSLQASSVNAAGPKMSDGFGRTQSESFASFDQNTGSLKTRQQSLALMMDGPSLESSVDWPGSGMMCCGTAFPLPPLAQDTDESGSGYLLPTPIARDWKDTPGMSQTGTNPDGSARKREDTLPRRIYALENSTAQSGIINPAFSLWLMGFPAGWLECDYTPSETRSSRKSLKSSCAQSPESKQEAHRENH